MKSLLARALNENSEVVPQQVGLVTFLLFTYFKKEESPSWCDEYYTEKWVQLMSVHNAPLTDCFLVDPENNHGLLFSYYLDPADSGCVWVFVNEDRTYRKVNPTIYLLQNGYNNIVLTEKVSTYTGFSAWRVMKQGVRLVGEIRRTDDLNDRCLVLLEGGKYHVLLEQYDGHNAVDGCLGDHGRMIIHARMKAFPDKVSVFVLEPGATDLKLEKRIRPEPGVQYMVNVPAQV